VYLARVGAFCVCDPTDSSRLRSPPHGRVCLVPVGQGIARVRGGVAEFRVTSYDGRDLKGRVLLGATVDPLVIDGRLYEAIDVDVVKLRACGKTELLTYWSQDWIRPPPRPDQLVTLQRGYWYGGKVHFFLFDERTGSGPECFEAELVVRASGWRVAATLPIRVVRTDKPPATPAEGTEEPKPPASETGAP
jgi:hypothetical protein